MDVVDGRFRVIELAEGVTIDDIRNCTEGDVDVADNVVPMQQ